MQIFLMLKVPYTKNGVRLLKISFSSFKLPYYKLALHRPIHVIGERAPCAYPILDPNIFSKFESWKEEIPKVSPNFQNMLQYMTS